MKCNFHFVIFILKSTSGNIGLFIKNTKFLVSCLRTRSCKALGNLGNIVVERLCFLPMFPCLSTSGKHCCGNKICFPGSKNVCQEIQKHFCCGNNTVRINGLQNRFAICEAFLRFCEANFIQKYKNAKPNENSLKSSQKIVGKITQDTQSSSVHFDC